MQMLQLIYGTPASGKTYTIVEKIKELSVFGKNCVLIVPEQFSFESEKNILAALGDRASLSVSVLSFSRLCDEVGRNVGGIAGIVLSDADKVIFMNRALKNIASELKLWSRYAGSASFAKTMIDTIGEFKINSVSPDDLQKAAENIHTATLKHKLLDIALIYEMYDSLLGEKFIDTADNLSRLYEKLMSYDFFKNKTVFFDCFKGFTGQQFKIIERILSQADDVFMALTTDPTIKGQFNVFSNISATAQKITSFAKSRAVEIASPIILGEARYKNAGLHTLERLMAGADVNNAKSDGGVSVCLAETIFDEAEFTARTIRKLVRENGYRYSDFVIIARDAERYQSAVAAACRRNDVTCFYDSKIPLSAFPISRSVISALDALSLETSAILRFHKTGITTLTTDEISLLENYAYLWNIEGDMWNRKWDMNPYGFVTENRFEIQVEKQLSEINRLRLAAVNPIKKFKEKFQGSAYDMGRAIVSLLEDSCCSDKLCEISNLLKEHGNLIFEGALRQSYDEFMKILDSLVTCFGQASIKRQEFIDALQLAVSLSSIGVIPQTLDQVTFGSADRIRPSRPKIAFILGANQDEFPKNTLNNGIFALSERKSLIENGINISDNAIHSTIDENFLVYCNVCCASERIYICFSKQTVSGEKKEPSAFVSSIMDKLDCDIFNEPEQRLSEANAPETTQACLSEYCKRLRLNTQDAESIKSALNSVEKFKELSSLEEKLNNKKVCLSKSIASQLFGKKIFMSASKLDTYSRCHFSYFCKYGLKASKLQPAEFDVLQRGTIVHYVLERIITLYSKEIGDFTAERLNELTDQFINEYLDSVSGYRSVQNSRTEFLVSRISRSLKDVVLHIAAEIKQSKFEPVACELKIGDGGEIPAVSFGFDEGEIVLTGSIDRVDEYNGYVRVIDYKTGNKSFKLPDILFGLNLQMLIYLYALIRAQGKADENAAGILYMPSKRDIKEEGMAMNGLLQADADLIYAMDAEGKGDFVPKLSLNKDGSVGKRSAAFIEKEKFSEIFDYIEKIMTQTGKSLIGGNIDISPVDGRESAACKYCDFAAVCGIEDSEIFKVPRLNNDAVFEAIKEANDNGV